MYKESIGIIGVASVSTVDFFKRVVEAFPGTKEWDRPRVLINNDCALPSRDRAVLFNENVDKLKSTLKDAVREMDKLLSIRGGGKIIIPCGTVFYWIDELRSVAPNTEIIDLIEICGKYLTEINAKNVTVIGTEGTHKIKLFDSYFEKTGIKIHHPVEQFDEYRALIEEVKQCKVTDDSITRFIELINNSPSDTVILGCTDLPVLYGQCQDGRIKKTIVDPLEVAIKKLLISLK